MTIYLRLLLEGCRVTDSWLRPTLAFPHLFFFLDFYPLKGKLNLKVD